MPATHLLLNKEHPEENLVGPSPDGAEEEDATASPGTLGGFR